MQLTGCAPSPFPARPGHVTHVAQSTTPRPQASSELTGTPLHCRTAAVHFYRCTCSDVARPYLDHERRGCHLCWVGGLFLHNTTDKLIIPPPVPHHEPSPCHWNPHPRTVMGMKIFWDARSRTFSIGWSFRGNPR